MDMKTSPEGRRQLIAREGVRLNAYRDSVGVWTIGVGHTSAAGPPTVYQGLKITRQEADELLSRDLVQYENAVNNNVKIPLKQNEFDALVSFCYNIGTGGLARSQVVKLLNAGNRAGAAEALMNWNKPEEIIGRRRTEKAQFLTPYKSSSQIDKPIVVEPKKDVVTGPAVATTGIGGLVLAFWDSPYFWPVLIGLGLLTVGISILIHKHNNRKL